MKKVLAVALFFLAVPIVVSAKPKQPRQPITVEVARTQTLLYRTSTRNNLVAQSFSYGVAIYALDAGKHVLYSCEEHDLNRCQYFEPGAKLSGEKFDSGEVEFKFAGEKKPVRYRAQGGW